MFSFTKKGIRFRKYTPSELEVRRINPGQIFLPVGAVYLEPGDRVPSGHKISELNGVPVYAPIDGVFAGVVQMERAGRKADHAVLALRGADSPDPAYNSLKIPTVDDLVAAAELLFAPGLPGRIGAIPGRKVVIRALDEGPDQATHSGLLRNYLGEILSAAGWLEKLSGGQVTIYTNNLSAKMYVRDHSAQIDVQSVSAKYPSAYWLEKKLKKIDPVVFDAWEVRGLFHCIAYGRPPRCVPVSRCVWGERVELCQVPVGTPVAALFEEIPENSRIVLNGVLQGRVVAANTPISLGDGAVTLVTDRAEQPVACIGCGRCAAACPVGILPMLLNAQWANRDENTAKQYGAHRCIGCGACSYICPSKLPLCDRIRAMTEVSDHA